MGDCPWLRLRFDGKNSETQGVQIFTGRLSKYMEYGLQFSSVSKVRGFDSPQVDRSEAQRLLRTRSRVFALSGRGYVDIFIQGLIKCDQVCIACRIGFITLNLSQDSPFRFHLPLRHQSNPRIPVSPYPRDPTVKPQSMQWLNALDNAYQAPTATHNQGLDGQLTGMN